MSVLDVTGILKWVISTAVKTREQEPTIFRVSLAWFLTGKVDKLTCYGGRVGVNKWNLFRTTILNRS